MIEWLSGTLPEQAGVSTWIGIAGLGFFTPAAALTALFGFTLTLFALPNDSDDEDD